VRGEEEALKVRRRLCQCRIGNTTGPLYRSHPRPGRPCRYVNVEIESEPIL